jgi:predicted signal transduction protein with EAL and GGDEF domain
VRDISDVARSAERIADALRQPFDLDGQDAHVSASIGIALDTDRGHAPDDLMREADMAMYRAKQSGKSRYEIFDPGMNTEAMERLDLETDLRQAVERNELTLAYQSLVHLGSNALEAYQAHLRWQHPRHGLLEPDAFLPLADDPAAVAALERWAIARACRDALALGHAVAVTISTWTSDLPEFVRATLASTGLLADQLALGCFESAVADDESRAIEVALEDLRALGVATYLDGFGAGALSLRQLHRLPIDALAINPPSIEDHRVQRSVVALAQTLELEALVARGLPQPVGEWLGFARPTAA